MFFIEVKMIYNVNQELKTSIFLLLINYFPEGIYINRKQNKLNQFPVGDKHRKM